MSFDKRLLFNKDLFEVHTIQVPMLSNCFTLKRNGDLKLFTKNQLVYFVDSLDFLVSQTPNSALPYWLIFFGFNSMNIHVPGLQFFIRFHTHAKIQATQADRIIPFNGSEMNGVKYALFYSLIASLGWGNWVLFPPLTEWIMTSSDPQQGLENLDQPLFKQKGILCFSGMHCALCLNFSSF